MSDPTPGMPASPPSDDEAPSWLLEQERKSALAMVSDAMQRASDWLNGGMTYAMLYDVLSECDDETLSRMVGRIVANWAPPAPESELAPEEPNGLPF